jgi:hypothetical protein
MSANVSRQCQIELLRKQWAERLRAFLERGWRIDLSRGEIVAIDTVLASYQRGQTLLLWCRRADCRRRFEVDPSNLPEARQQGGRLQPNGCRPVIGRHPYRLAPRRRSEVTPVSAAARSPPHPDLGPTLRLARLTYLGNIVI